MPNAEGGSVPLQLRDLNGDGTPDLLTMNASPTRLKLNATSGRDGKLLWSTDLKPPALNEFAPANAPISLGCHVMETGRGPDVLLLYAAGAGNAQQLWLARITGRDGQIRWRQPVSEQGSFPSNACQIPLATADLDGDGVNDIVMWVPLSQSEAEKLSRSGPGAPEAGQKGTAPTTNIALPSLPPHYELRAVSGREGKLLWHRPGFFMRYDNSWDRQDTESTWNQWFLRPIPEPVVADLDGDGHPIVLITDAYYSVVEASVKGSYAEVVALNGRDGKAKWTWRGDTGYDMDLSANWLDSWVNSSPQIVRIAAGKAIAVSICDHKLASGALGKSGNQIVVLNLRGQVLQRTDISSPGKSDIPKPVVRFVDRAKLWVGDLNDDGHDEIVWIDESYSLRREAQPNGDGGGGPWIDEKKVRAMRPAMKNGNGSGHCPAQWKPRARLLSRRFNPPAKHIRPRLQSPPRRVGSAWPVRRAKCAGGSTRRSRPVCWRTTIHRVCPESGSRAPAPSGAAPSHCQRTKRVSINP